MEQSKELLLWDSAAESQAYSEMAHSAPQAMLQPEHNLTVLKNKRGWVSHFDISVFNAARHVLAFQLFCLLLGDETQVTVQEI